MKRLTLLFAFLFIVGCDSQAYLEKQWLGRSKNTLIDVKGVPDKVISDGFGGEIYSYVTYSVYPSTYGTHYHPHSWPHHYYFHEYGFDYSHTITQTGGTNFWIDPFDKIYRVSTSY